MSFRSIPMPPDIIPAIPPMAPCAMLAMPGILPEADAGIRLPTGALTFSVSCTIALTAGTVCPVSRASNSSGAVKLKSWSSSTTS